MKTTNFYRDKNGKPLIDGQTIRFSIPDEMEETGICEHEVVIAGGGIGWQCNVEDRFIPFAEFRQYDLGVIDAAEVINQKELA